MATDNCVGCGGSHPSYAPPPIEPCKTCGCGEVNASDVTYNSAALSCSGAGTNKKLDEILQIFDEYMCTAIGTDWSGFDYNCLDAETEITTPGQFVDEMTSQFCDHLTAYNTFVTETYIEALQYIQNQVTSIIDPDLTLCPYSGIVPTDSYPAILLKLSTKLCELNERLDLTTVGWDQCSTVPDPPTDLVEGFDFLMGLICELQENQGTVVLPTFNNIGSCLPSPGAADTLVATINKIKTRLCQSTTYTIDDDMWTCLSTPTTFQEAFDSVVVSHQATLARIPVFDTDIFELTPDGCNGVLVTLQDGVAGTDRLVAATAGDLTPGVLGDKLAAGTNITLSSVAVSGKIQINATFTDQSVKVNGSDTTSGFLASKLQGGTNSGVTISTSATVGNDKVQIVPTVDMTVVANNFFDIVENDPDLYARFCTLICGCRPCNEPGNPVPPTLKRVQLKVTNNNPTTTFTNDYVLTQVSPVLGWVNANITLAPSETYVSGWYDVTSSNTPLVSQLQVSSAAAQNLTIRVLQPSMSTVPGSSAFSGALGAGYTNNAFSLGSLTTDMTVEIQLS